METIEKSTENKQTGNMYTKRGFLIIQLDSQINLL